jgi:simple sugar transport system ATP-binding protein
VSTGTTDIRHLDLSVRAGEVIGLAGLEGSGQRALLDAVAGLIPSSGGDAVLDGATLTGLHYHDRLAAGIHYLPAGRLEEGLVADLTIEEHVALTTPGQRFVIDWDAAESAAAASIAEFDVRGSPDTPAGSLSGGNQQRLLLSLMPPSIRLLLMEHPTRGLDLESAEEIWAKIRQRREAGTAVLFASADLDELLTYSDRIIVFFSGRVFEVVEAEGADTEQLGYLIGGRERP